MSLPIQKIIFGSPGTGKSYQIDSKIIPDDLKIDIKDTPENVIKAVFHPEYTHGDFMGKLLPVTKSGQVEYKFYEGHFLKALGQAYKNYIKAHDKQGNQVDEVGNVVLVIDEINRGNSASIFGSVFQLLDRDGDGWSSYNISINGVAFMRLLELIGVEISYKDNLAKYNLEPYSSIKGLEDLHKKINFLNFDLINKTVKMPPNLSIVATMNTSDSSIYYMDSAFKRRWDWEFIDVDSDAVVVEQGLAFKDRLEWEIFVKKLNYFIKSKHKYIRGIEDKQIGKYFIKEDVVSKAVVQSKVMFFLWDNVFARDKKPLEDLLFEGSKELVTFGDFAKEIELFINKIKNYHV